MQMKKKLITQFGGKLRDERFEPNQSIFEHYLPNKNECATVSPKSKFTQLNKAEAYPQKKRVGLGSQTLTNNTYYYYYCSEIQVIRHSRVHKFAAAIRKVTFLHSTHHHTRHHQRGVAQVAAFVFLAVDWTSSSTTPMPCMLDGYQEFKMHSSYQI